MQFEPQKATNRAGASGWAVYDIEAGQFACAHIWKTRKACAAECQSLQDEASAELAEKQAALVQIAADKAAKVAARAERIARALAAKDMAARQLQLPLPAPRQRAPKPCPVRAAMLRQIAAKRSLMRPVDPDCSALAELLFVRCGSLSTLCQTLHDNPKARRWVATCEKAGLLWRRPHSIFTNNHEWIARADCRALI